MLGFRPASGTAGLGRTTSGPRGNGPKYFLIHALGLVGLKIARDAEDRIVRDVVRAEKRRHVGQPGGREVGHRADHAVVIRMIGRIKRLEQRLLGLAIGHVVDRLAALVLDHVALVVEPLLRHRRQQEAHPIGLEPERQLECVAGHGLVIDRVVLARRAVQVGAQLLERHEVIAVVVLRALEHHVLEEVGKAGSAGLFVLRADPVPEIDRDDRRLVVFVKQDRQAVGKGVFLDLEHGDLRFPWLDGRWLGRTQHRPPKSQDHHGQAGTVPAACRRSHESRSLREQGGLPARGRLTILISIGGIRQKPLF